MLLEYLNRSGLELMRKYPMGMIKNAFDWGEPFVFGVPDGQDREYFLEAGLELGETLKIGSPESMKLYATRKDGSYYGAHLEKVFRQRHEAVLEDHGRYGTPTSRPGSCHVGLLACRVGRAPAGFVGT